MSPTATFSSAGPEDARILVVCTGNVCRSPIMEHYLRRHLDERWHGDGTMLVASAGTAALVGSPMDERADLAARSLGLNTAGFIARALTVDAIAGADLVLTATRQHRGIVVSMYPKALRTCFAVRDFSTAVDDLYDRSGTPGGLDGETVPADARDRVQRVVAAAAARRGFSPPLDPVDADITDPYRRPDEVYAVMLGQIVEAMPGIVEALAG
jgi:protein-tyrosine phosphatase